MLGLLSVLFVADPMLQSLVSPYLGLVGGVVAFGWIALTVVKVRLLTQALALRLPRAAFALVAMGAAGIALLPFMLASNAQSQLWATTLVGAWLLALALVARPLYRRLVSRDDLDSWGETVLRRGAMGTWCIWGAAALGHAVFWSTEFGLRVDLWLYLVAPLVVAYLSRREGVTWGLASGTLLHALLLPQIFSAVAAMTAATLVLRGFRGPSERRAWSADATPSAHPYRVCQEAPAEPDVVLVCPDPLRPAAKRLYVGALACVYLALFSWSWQGGPLPTHELWLDVPVALLLALAMWRWRSVVAGLVFATIGSHVAWSAGWLPRSVSALELGVGVLAAGFVALLAGVLLDLRQRRPAGEEGAKGDLPG